MTSRTPGAQTSIDGGPPRDVPLVARVSPGEHTVVLRASGYFEETEKIIVVEHETSSLNVLLRPKPVALRVRGDDGARVYLDGQLLTRLPSPGPLMLQGGEHNLSVTRPGHVPYSTALSLPSGSRVELDVALLPTTQRYTAYAALGLGGASVLVTGILAGLAASDHLEAQSIKEDTHDGQLDVAQRDGFNEALADRDGWLARTAVAGSVAAALCTTGLALYLIDDPDVSAAGERRPARDAPERRTPGTELFLDGSALSLRVRF